MGEKPVVKNQMMTTSCEGKNKQTDKTPISKEIEPNIFICYQLVGILKNMLIVMHKFKLIITQILKYKIEELLKFLKEKAFGIIYYTKINDP